ncbi:MAG: S1 RNA-binding domain-containing protein [Chitinispirillaceae bacterium]|nr:S1 RNA-binding domain-containing protein [Chitinispirillaceae bacterium]
MIEFSKQVSEKWNIPVEIAEQVCSAYSKGDTPYYLGEYHLTISTHLITSEIWEIYDFLGEMEEISQKKKKVLSAAAKAGILSPQLEKRINLTTNPFELDDINISLRPNPRSRAQIAIKKGLKPLADLLFSQTEEKKSPQELAEEYVSKDPSLQSIEDVLAGVKDIIAEMMAYDETARAMVREFAIEDGFFEVIPKSKDQKDFNKYVGKSLPVNELSTEEILHLFVAEDKKHIRLRLSVELFRITELLRQHFITNPDSTSYDLLCETIDDCWLRLLEPIVERDGKEKIRKKCENLIKKQLVKEIEKLVNEEKRGVNSLLVDSEFSSKNILFLAVNSKGELLGTTTEKKPPENRRYVLSERLRQFLLRHKPRKIVIAKKGESQSGELIVNEIVSNWSEKPQIVFFTPTAEHIEVEWINKKFGDLLDEEMKKMYLNMLLYLKPVTLIPEIGVDLYTVHPFQELISATDFVKIVERVIIDLNLKEGISIKEITESVITKIIPLELVQAIRAADANGNITAKNDLIKVQGMEEVSFRNIAGFIQIPAAPSLIDRSTVHPDYFDWFNEISQSLNISIEALVNEPEYLRSYFTEEPSKKIFIEKKLIAHLSSAKKYLSQPSIKPKRKFKLTELKEGEIVSGVVTNITPFGVFVNINAVCDGLIHISQLADEYVESPEQVVSLNDRVVVRILKVDVKKRRISLSMKNLGVHAPKVRPSKGQLNSLAEHFKNR